MQIFCCSDDACDILVLYMARSVFSWNILIKMKMCWCYAQSWTSTCQSSSTLTYHFFMASRRTCFPESNCRVLTTTCWTTPSRRHAWRWTYNAPASLLRRFNRLNWNKSSSCMVIIFSLLWLYAFAASAVKDFWLCVMLLATLQILSRYQHRWELYVFYLTWTCYIVVSEDMWTVKLSCDKII